MRSWLGLTVVTSAHIWAKDASRVVGSSHIIYRIYSWDNPTSRLAPLVWGSSKSKHNGKAVGGMRGAVVEWLERLGYGAESRRKVVSSRLGFAMRRLENSICQPSSKWEPFSNQGKTWQRKERNGLRLSSAVSKIQWNSNPHCPYGY